MTKVFEDIIALLKIKQVDFIYREHEPTLTSEDSARVRGESLSSGAKAILYKIQDEFHLFVMAADRKMDPKKIKTYFKDRGKRVKKTRFATREELDELTGLLPGSIPPFGRPILDFDLYVDPSLLENEKISFNAGSLKHSVTMKLEDFIKVAEPDIFNFIAD